MIDAGTFKPAKVDYSFGHRLQQFSNIVGRNQIPSEKGKIESSFEKVRDWLARDGFA